MSLDQKVLNQKNFFDTNILSTKIFFEQNFWCCNNCPRDDSPRRQLSKGLLSNDTIVQGDYCPMGLFSKEAFTNEKLAQINFSYFLLEVTTFIDYRISKKIM